MNRTRSFLAGLAFGIAGLGAALAANLTGPIDPASIVANINAAILNWMSFINQGELQLLGPQAFSANGTVATAMSSLGPVGSHTTVQEWMIVVDPAGNVRYVPTF